MTIFGSSRNSEILQENKVAVNTTFTSELNDAAKKFWEFDSKLDQKRNENGLFQDDRSCLNKLQKDTKLVDGHYEVPMLWLDRDVKLPNNFYMALIRFKLLRKRLQRDSTLQKKYEEIMKGYIKNWYANKL